MIIRGWITNTLIACLIIVSLFLLTSCTVDDPHKNNESDRKDVYVSPDIQPVSVDEVKNKEELRQRYIQHLDNNMTYEEKAERTNELTYELVQMLSNDESEQIINAVMHSKNVFRLILSGSEQVSTEDNENSHVSLQIPYVFYDAVTDWWIVASGGVWKVDSWFDTLAEQSFKQEANAYIARIGGADTIRIQFDQTTGPYPERITGDAYILIKMACTKTLETQVPEIREEEFLSNL